MSKSFDVIFRLPSPQQLSHLWIAIKRTTTGRARYIVPIWSVTGQIVSVYREELL